MKVEELRPKTTPRVSRKNRPRFGNSEAGMPQAAELVGGLAAQLDALADELAVVSAALNAAERGTPRHARLVRLLCTLSEARGRLAWRYLRALEKLPEAVDEVAELL